WRGAPWWPASPPISPIRINLIGGCLVDKPLPLPATRR
ncbi:MAG: hypothetical protein AVDCRST_MAG66-217, partial [uncultured Pseudonocardia sp.]